MLLFKIIPRVAWSKNTSKFMSPCHELAWSENRQPYAKAWLVPRAPQPSILPVPCQCRRVRLSAGGSSSERTIVQETGGLFAYIRHSLSASQILSTCPHSLSSSNRSSELCRGAMHDSTHWTIEMALPSDSPRRSGPQPISHVGDSDRKDLSSGQTHLT